MRLNNGIQEFKIFLFPLCKKCNEIVLSVSTSGYTMSHADINNYLPTIYDPSYP